MWKGERAWCGGLVGLWEFGVGGEGRGVWLVDPWLRVLVSFGESENFARV